MKSQIRTVALSALFSTIGFCCSLSTASAEPRSAQVDQNLSIATYMFAFPTLTSEGGSNEKPFLAPGNKLKELQACKATKNNEYFELAIILNDKLQQLISSFSNNESEESNDTQLSQVTKIN